MEHFQFRASVLCLKPDTPITVSPLQHCLPPQSQIIFVNSPSSHPNFDEELTEQLELLKQKNNNLIDLINVKERQRCAIDRKYNELLIMYNELKEQKIDEGAQRRIFQLEGEKQILLERVAKMEEQLENAEMIRNRKIKEYEDSKEDSRRLLERLNENITKKEQRLQQELQFLTKQIGERDEQIEGKERKINELQMLLLEKDEEITKNIQQTEREKSTFSENVSLLSTRLQQQNQQLKAQLQNIHLQYDDLLNRYNQISEANALEKQSSRNQFNKYSILSEENVELRSIIDRLQFQKKELESRVIVLEADGDRLLKDLQTKKEENKKLNGEMVDMSDQITRLERQLQQEQNSYKNLQTNLNGLNKQYELSQNQIQRLHEKISIMKKEIEELQVEELNHKQIMQELRQRTKQQETKILHLQKIIKQMDQKNWALQKLLADYKDEKPRMREQFERKWQQMKDFYESELYKLEEKNRLKMQERKSPAKIITTHRSTYKENLNSGANTDRASFGTSP